MASCKKQTKIKLFPNYSNLENTETSTYEIINGKSHCLYNSVKNLAKELQQSTDSTQNCEKRQQSESYFEQTRRARLDATFAYLLSVASTASNFENEGCLSSNLSNCNNKELRSTINFNIKNLRDMRDFCFNKLKELATSYYGLTSDKAIGDLQKKAAVLKFSRKHKNLEIPCKFQYSSEEKNCTILKRTNEMHVMYKHKTQNGNSHNELLQSKNQANNLHCHMRSDGSTNAQKIYNKKYIIRNDKIAEPDQETLPLPCREVKALKDKENNQGVLLNTLRKLTTIVAKRSQLNKNIDKIFIDSNNYSNNGMAKSKIVNNNQRELELFKQKVLDTRKSNFKNNRMINLKDVIFYCKQYLNEQRICGPYEISSGTFCTIYLGQYLGNEVAVKCPIHELVLKNPEVAQRRTMVEWQILNRAYHENIVKLYGLMKMGQSYCLVTEYVPGGDLYYWLHFVPAFKISGPIRLRMMIQIASALSYLHEVMDPKVVHKDLKSNNILVDGNFNLKLCDFGDAEEMDKKYFTGYTAATWLYAPPEVIEAADYTALVKMTEKVDIWALGCILLELITLPVPFKHIVDETCGGMEQLEQIRRHLYARKNKLFTFPSLPFNLRYIIECCLSLNQYMRPKASQVVNYLHKNESAIVDEINYVLVCNRC